MTDNAALFQQAMQSMGLAYDGEIRANTGNFERFGLSGDTGKPCWYILNILEDNIAIGSFGCFKRDIHRSWHSYDEKQLTPAQCTVITTAKTKLLDQTKKEQQAYQAEALSHAQPLWQNAPPASNHHAYLQKKQVQAHGIKSSDRFNGQAGDWLLIPLYAIDGDIISIQGILPNGTKRFYSGLSTKGVFIFGELSSTTPQAYLCEGWATGATIREVTACPVVCTFNCGNLKNIAKQYSTRYPSIQWIIASDNDSSHAKNIGLETTKSIAKDLDLTFAYPIFKDTNNSSSDFNDLFRIGGADAVKAQLAQLNYEQETDEEAIKRLAELSPLDYDRQRTQAAKKLGVSVTILDGEVKKQRQAEQATEDNSNEEYRQGVEPYQGHFVRHELADEIAKRFTTHTILPRYAEYILTLWIIGTYCFNNFRIFPFLCLTSPEKRCGKTTTLSLLDGLVNRSLLASNITASAIFRSIESWTPTLLIDEADTFLHGNDELRGILNSGHTRDTAYVIRTEGDSKKREPKRFSTWSPRAIASIKMPPDTIVDRSIVIALKRKLVSEKVQALPLSFKEDCLELRQQCQSWANVNTMSLQRSKPSVPATGNDRAEQNWLPLFAIAKQLGGEWLNYATLAIKEFASVSDDNEVVGVRLLTDIQHIFASKNLDKIHSVELVNQLMDIEERNWADFRKGKELNTQSVAKLLKPYGIKSKQLKIGGNNKHGYEKCDFADAFSRYTVSKPILEDLDATPLQPNGSKGFKGFIETLPNATRRYPATFCEKVASTSTEVAGHKNKTLPLQPNDSNGGSGVASRTPHIEAKKDSQTRWEDIY